jgi:phage terminase small subunit
MSHVLTPKQEQFAQSFILHGNATKAYREVYKPKTDNKASHNRRAAELMGNSKVTARIAELRKPAADTVILTLAEHLAELAEIRDLAKAEKQFSAASSAELSRGKAAGLYVEKKHITGAMTVESFLSEVGDDA